MGYARTVRVHAGFARTVDAARQALASQGFGVLTEIDVAATLKSKIGRDMEDYVILGACNPQLAERALDIDRDIGLLLPCNVVVRTEGSTTVVQALDPATMVTSTGLDAMSAVADEATRRLDIALAQLAEELNR
ncbi:DUF302 domain-containing protein [Streptomyces sp. NPDC048560]|uniref:DUF302 domain-containing protein n=1 Tax=Streptomyces sp. NPDC048560 TaxID=3155488 RepID=UPI00341DD350